MHPISLGQRSPTLTRGEISHFKTYNIFHDVALLIQLVKPSDQNTHVRPSSLPHTTLRADPCSEEIHMLQVLPSSFKLYGLSMPLFACSIGAIRTTYCEHYHNNYSTPKIEQTTIKNIRTQSPVDHLPPRSLMTFTHVT